MTSGIEWNYRFGSKTDQKNFDKFFKTFEELFEHHSIVIDDEELKRYSKNWHKPSVSKDLEKYDSTEAFEDTNVRLLYEPRGAQIEALCALEDTRAEGAKRALGSAATGVGKTYLAAFDARNFDAKRVLFVCHRDKILSDAKETFMKVFGQNKTYGLFVGDKKEVDCDFIFASNIMMSQHLSEFDKKEFDYICLDEAHQVDFCVTYQN